MTLFENPDRRFADTDTDFSKSDTSDEERTVSPSPSEPTDATQSLSPKDQEFLFDVNFGSAKHYFE